MKKTTIIFLLLMLFTKIAFSQMIVRFSMRDEKRYGYGVDVFYYISNVDSMVQKIENIKNIDEQDLLGGIGIPILGKGDFFDTCTCCSSHEFNVDLFFRKNKPSYSIELKIKSIILHFEFIGINNPNACEVQLRRKIWPIIFNSAVYFNAKITKHHLPTLTKKKINTIKQILIQKKVM